MKLTSSSSVLVITTMALAMLLITTTDAFQCGQQAGGALCANRWCCSRWGYCGLSCGWLSKRWFIKGNGGGINLGLEDATFGST
ncbi:hypothetical protein DM860_015178 [Cuscuta australis]|uniref:Chitin-binding type-1 domain-containing protein n=1 Tax=Cuscuta australis TaxID=267555 RepID=A0A328DFJ0_9ASTE|nr:hypothetical protein DM860_015178 [Cuscuta australis]